MSPDETRKRTPPYISPLTFRQLLEDLARAPVARVDRSYLTTLHAGGTSGQIIAALHYMNLLEVSGKPGVKLDLLAKAKIQPDQADYKGYLREILENSYAFVLR